MKKVISKVVGRMVFDSRGIPTIEAEIFSEEGISAKAIAPSGASKGRKEAYEKRDKKKSFNGLSVFENLQLINKNINKGLYGFDVTDQNRIDNFLINLDGSKYKKNLGGNTTIAVSMAALKLAALSHKKPLWKYLNYNSDNLLPLPQVQIMGGGAHAKGSLSLQDFLIIPNGANSFYTAIEWIFKVYMLAGNELEKRKLLRGVADEGGYWPAFSSNIEVFDFLTEIISKAGFEPLKEISIAIDVAANNCKIRNKYNLFNNEYLSGDDLISIYLKWINKYPIISIEDPFAEDDILLFQKLKKKLPSYIQIVGDDLVVTNSKMINKAKRKNAINTVLIKPNQIGTITETKEALDLTNTLELMSILSARSGETEDTTISDLSVGWGIKQFKVGSFSRSERLAKWNQCLRIGECLSNNYLMHNIYELNWHSL